MRPKDLAGFEKSARHCPAESIFTVNFASAIFEWWNNRRVGRLTRGCNGRSLGLAAKLASVPILLDA